MDEAVLDEIISTGFSNVAAKLPARLYLHIPFNKIHLDLLLYDVSQGWSRRYSGWVSLHGLVRFTWSNTEVLVMPDPEAYYDVERRYLEQMVDTPSPREICFRFMANRTRNPYALETCRWAIQDSLTENPLGRVHPSFSSHVWRVYRRCLLKDYGPYTCQDMVEEYGLPRDIARIIGFSLAHYPASRAYAMEGYARTGTESKLRRGDRTGINGWLLFTDVVYGPTKLGYSYPLIIPFAYPWYLLWVDKSVRHQPKPR